MTNFQCALCGNSHDASGREWGFTAPDPWAQLSEHERETAGAFTLDACVIYGVAWLLRGCVFLTVADRPEQFAWGMWVYVTEPNYQRIAQLQATVGLESEPSFAARLANTLPHTVYPSTLNLKCRLQLMPLGQRPAIIIEPSVHPLATEQREGIPIARLREIAHFMDESPNPSG